MSREDRCSFCEGLPRHVGRSGRNEVRGRCPLCKGELLADHVSGVTYRLEPENETSPRGRRGLETAVVAGVMLAGMLGLLAKYGPWAGKPEPPTPQETVRATPVQFDLPPPRQETAVPVPERLPPPAVVLAVEPQPAPSPELLPPPFASPEPQRVARQPALRLPARTHDELAAMLQKVPEVSLLNGPPEAAWKEVEKAVREHKERFLEHVLAQRPDLAQLPIRDAKDCQLDAKAAKNLQDTSLAVRCALSSILGRRGSAREEHEADAPESAGFKLGYEIAKSEPLRGTDGIPALEQVLAAETPQVRFALVGPVHPPADLPAVGAMLTRRVLFDTQPAIRQGAIGALTHVSPKNYLKPLLEGLRYPWPPANAHAAEALAALRAEAAVPELLRMLDDPDPCEPFEVEKDGRKVASVREVVRLNHNANCLVCHPPSFASTDLVRSPVPTPLKTLPPRFSPILYGHDFDRTNGVSVRADITHLRQDFSVLQPVEKPGKWAKVQRFDFLVRVRPLAETEAAAWREQHQLVGPRPLPPRRQAVLYALQELTRLDGGYTRASWERTLADPAGVESPP